MDNLDFTQLILLLLPGFWSLWIYTPFTGYDLEAREWQVKAMMALGFGVFNLMLLSLINLYVIEIDTAGVQLLSVAVLSVLTGLAAGWLAQKEWLPTIIWQKLKGNSPLPYEKALDYLSAHRRDLYAHGGPYALMKVYPVGEEDKALIGEYAWDYAKTGEVILLRTPLYKGLTLEQYDNVVINDPASNRVFEIYPMTGEEMNRLQDERIVALTSS
jgi:hypothetical protein